MGVSHSLVVQHVFAAVAQGDVAALRKVLDARVASPDVRSAAGSTALVAATQARQYAVMELLLRRGADPAALDDDGIAALHYAAESGDVDAATLLCGSGGARSARTVATRTSERQTAAEVAVKQRHCAVLRVLLRAGAQPDTLDAAGRTLLCCAAEVGDADAVRALLDYGATIDAAEPRHGRTALHCAVLHDHVECARQLLRDHRCRGELLLVEDSVGKNALHHAVCRANLSMVKLLLQEAPHFFPDTARDASVAQLYVNRPARDGKTCLHHAVDACSYSTFAYLVNCGAALRPALPGSRADLAEYALDALLTYREDASSLREAGELEYMLTLLRQHGVVPRRSAGGDDAASTSSSGHDP